MILCINPNAAIDKTVVVTPFHLNEIHRPQSVLAIPGGKGCNVARALKRLGGTPVVSGWIGGFAGQFIEAGLRDEGIQTRFIKADFESRTCLSILDSENNTLTEIYEKGEVVPPAKLQEFNDFLRVEIGQYQAVTFSGSLPPGAPADFYANAINIAHQAGIPAILDTSGEALRQGIAAKPFLVKPNKKEFADLIGKELDTISDLASAVAEVASRYQTHVVVSLGSEGALATSNPGYSVLHFKPPTLAIKSAVGSGDCLIAGVTYGIARGLPIEDAVKYGIAAGSANTLTVGAGIFSMDDFARILEQVQIQRV